MIFRALVLLCTIWGCNFVVMKTANEFFSPELFVTYRFLSGAAVLLAVAFFTKLAPPPKKFWVWIVLSGFFQIAAGSIILQNCFKYLDAGLTSVLNYTMPMWVTILAAIFLHEPLTKKKIVGIALSIAGVGTLMNVEISGDFSAILMAISAAICWAIGNVIMKAKLSELNTTSLTTWQMAVSAVMLAIYTFAFCENFATWTALSVACVLYNGILASALAFILWVFILQHMEASKASISILGVPVVSVIAGVIFLGEPLTLSIVLGMLMVLAGIFIVQHS